MYEDGPDEVIKLTTDALQHASVLDYLGGAYFPNMLEDIGYVGMQHAGDLGLYMFKSERLRPTREADAATSRLARQVIAEVNASLRTPAAQTAMSGARSRAERYAVRSRVALAHLVESRTLPASMAEAFEDIERMARDYDNVVIDFHSANLMVRGKDELVFNDVVADAAILYRN